MKYLIYITLSLFSVSTFAQESGIQFEHDATWQQILAKAKAEQKYILLDAYASWCGPCKWMAKEVFPKPEAGKAINPYYVSAKIDMEKGEGIELAKQYQVRNYPTYLFFDANGELVHRSLGSMPAKDFIELCTKTLNPENQFITLKKNYLSGNRDTAFLRNFIFNANNAQDSLLQPAFIEFYQLTNGELTEANAALISNTTNSIHDTGYSIIQQNIEKFRTLLGKDVIDNQMEELVWNEAKRAGKKGTDMAAFKKVIAQYLPEKTELLVAEYELSLLKRAGNWKSYAEKAEKFATTFCWNDYERLNYIAYNLYENFTTKTVLQKALSYALRSVALNSKFENNDTVAHLYHKLNDKANARTYAKKALELANASGEDVFELEQFIKSLN